MNNSMNNPTNLGGTIRATRRTSRRLPVTLALGTLLSFTLSADAQTAGGVASTVQANARPFGLNIAASVMQAGSDARSANFQNNVLPGALSFIRTTLPERANNAATAGALNLDWSRLKLQSDYNVRAFFVSEGAGNHNSLGFNTAGSGVATGNPKLIFPDASSTLGGIHTGTPGTRTASEPVLPGDFVNLGTQSRGTLLDFFLIANGANGGRDVFSASGTGNPDGINHVASFTPRLFAVPQLNSPYIFISFEDLRGGGDNDFNDTVFALDVGRGTVNYLLGAPEPSLYLTLGGFLALAIWGKRRLNQTQPALSPCRA
jgi:hypothetical protein